MQILCPTVEWSQGAGLAKKLKARLQEITAVKKQFFTSFIGCVMNKSTNHRDAQNDEDNPRRVTNKENTETSVSWPRIGTERTLTEEVYEAVRTRLLMGESQPGTFIRESDLTEAMGVSRTPVREALGRLASEGFLERIPQRGFRVPEQSMDELFHLYPILTTLEVLAGELALEKLTLDELEELEQINHRFAEALETNDVVEAVEQNDCFHRFLSERSGNPLLRSRLNNLRMQIRRLEIWDFMEVLRGTPSSDREEWVHQHAAIIQAAKEGNYGEAANILRENRSLVHLAAHQSQQQAERDPSTNVPGGET